MTTHDVWAYVWKFKVHSSKLMHITKNGIAHKYNEMNNKYNTNIFHIAQRTYKSCSDVHSQTLQCSPPQGSDDQVWIIDWCASGVIVIKVSSL